jgi:nucleotide-binding universal stress UspA family protein
MSAAEAPADAKRKFLVVVDDTPECRLALRYAARRALKTRGAVTLLYVISPQDFQHFLGVEQIMRQEARQEAEHVLHVLAEEINAIAGLMPELVIREGDRKDQVLALIEEDPSIRILVLGAGTGKDGPGPLVTALAGQMAGSLSIPITVVPGRLDAGRIDELT